ncbi:hypothetical protein MMC30_006887 [Trapelia coarctata]|nr:hypothetical protein [Trapelia coarctata]
MSRVESIPGLVQQLQSLLIELNANPYPHVPNPPKCKKRASVALVLRIRPTFPDQAGYGAARFDKHISPQHKLESFFSQAWVQHGDPEVMFIKRAAREGDRWTSHVALPGGKQDPQDEDDRTTSVRETMEEIGLDLSQQHSQFVGNLPERVVTTAWGKIPLMVLCPFVFLLTRYDIPPLRLQPTEINSAHWVSVRALLAPSLRTFERCDVSDRLSHRGGELLRVFLRLALGQMLFAAVRLIPSESVYCSSVRDFIPEDSKSIRTSLKQKATELISGDHAASGSRDRPLLLWGLTHGIVADFLDLLPSYRTFKLWSWPTFSPWDVRLAVWLITYSFRKRKLRELESGLGNSPTIIEAGSDGTGPVESRDIHGVPHRVDMDGLGLSNRGKPLARRLRSGAVGHMFDGYYRLLRKAIAMAVLLRCGAGVALAAFILQRVRARGRNVL